MNYRFVLFLVLFPLLTYGQDRPNPVQIEFSLMATDLMQKVVADVTVDKGWYIYSSTTDADGPVPTAMILESLSDQRNGKLMEDGELIKKYDELFELEVAKYKEQVRFSREIDPSIRQVDGYLYYMVCDENRCLPPTEAKFSLTR